MTKFEEEAIKEAEKCGYVMAKSKIVFYEDEKGITFVDFNGTHTNFNFPWLEFAKNWHSDEEFQEHFIANKNLIDVNTKLAEEIANLKSQLQQQALPVVPECVGGIIKKYKGRQSVYGALKTIALNRKTDIYEWVFSEGNQNIFALAFITGKYEVEKQQLFYLKDNLTGMYLYKIMIAYNEGIKGYKWDTPTKKGLGAGNYKFTQSEIDSMETGSYELVPVDDGE